jgi:hypothetical protein
VRRVLYFTGADQSLYTSSGSKLELEATFAGDEEGITQFREHLRQRKGALLSLVADVAGEDFHEEQIPSLRGADRQAVVQRRLAQRYRDTRLAAALSLGTLQTAERRNERLLLASFTNTQQLTPWLDAVEEAGARLAGVYSVPLLASPLAACLGVRRGRAFVVTVNRAGVRQCFLEDGRLRFARLERAADMDPRALAMFVRSETLRLAQFLTTLRALPRDGAPIHALVVAPAGQRAVFEEALVPDGRLSFRTVDSTVAARAAGLKRVPEGVGAESIYLHLAANKAPRDQFASRDDRRRYVVWQLQRWIVAAGAFGFAACALFAGTKWLDAMEVRSAALSQATEARRAASEYQRITAAFPVTQTSTDNLRATVVEFTRIAAQTASPESALVHVSRVLEQFPQFEIERLDFSVGRPDARDKAVAGVPVPAPAAVPGNKANFPSDTALRLAISGRVNATERNDYRAITAQVRRFAGALGTAGYELARTELPFDITSEGTLTGDIGGATDPGEAPRFTIVLLRKLP